MVPSIRVERFGSYELEQTINVGSVGEVFLARWSDPARATDRAFVVKRLHRELARRPAHVELFIEEGRMAQRFAHPNLVHAFDAGSIVRGGERDYFIAMDLVRGPNLAQLAERGPVPPRAVQRIAADLCAALGHMHADGVVHCDVSPTNILIGPERTQLTDFGVTNRSGQPQPQVRGTVAYMSPEQARGEPVDGRSDVFSIGVVSWELLARRPLFLRPAPYLTLAAVVEDPVPEIGDPAARALAAVLRRALERELDHRWSSCEEMAAALATVPG